MPTPPRPRNCGSFRAPTTRTSTAMRARNSSGGVGRSSKLGCDSDRHCEERSDEAIAISRLMHMRDEIASSRYALLAMTVPSLRRDAELLDQAAPLLGVACRQRAERLGRGLRDLDGDLVHARLHLRQEEDAADLGVQLRHHVAR